MAVAGLLVEILLYEGQVRLIRLEHARPQRVAELLGRVKTEHKASAV